MFEGRRKGSARSPEDAPDDPALRPVLRSGPEGRDAAREHHVEDHAGRPQVRRRRRVRATHHLIDK